MSSRSEGVECPECGTDNSPNTKFCESCGLRFTSKDRGAAAPAAPRARASSRRRAKEEPAELHKSEQREIERSLGKARDQLKAVRIVLFVLATFYLMLTFYSWYGLTGDAQTFGIAIFGSMVAVLALGAVFLFDLPLLWVITTASVNTVVVLFFLAVTGVAFLRGPPGWLTILSTLALWGALPATLNIARLQRQYPGSITSGRIKRRTRSNLSEEASARLDKLEANRQSAATRSYIAVAAVLLVGVTSVILATNSANKNSNNAYANTSRRPELSGEEKAKRRKAIRETLPKFELAWKESDFNAVRALGSERFLNEKAVKVKDILERRGWSKYFPPIEYETTAGQTDTERHIWFRATPRGRLKTVWVWEDDAWKVERIVFSRMR